MEELASSLPAPVPPAEPSGAFDRLHPDWLGRGSCTAALVAATIVTDAAHHYLNLFQRLEPAAKGMMIVFWLVMNLAIFLPWSGVWALASRVFRQEARFVRHLNIALTALLAWTWVRGFVGLAAFAVSIDAYVMAPYYGLLWLMWTWALIGHLRQVASARGPLVSGAGAAIASVIVGILVSLQILALKKMPAMKGMQVTVHPHFLRLAGALPIDRHLESLGRVQAAVDARVQEKQTSPP